MRIEIIDGIDFLQFAQGRNKNYRKQPKISTRNVGDPFLLVN